MVEKQRRRFPAPSVFVYDEPHGQSVPDAWGRSRADFYRIIADLGYLVVLIDNRGPGRSRA